MVWSRFWYYCLYKLLFSWWSHIIQDHARLCQICANDSYSGLKIQWEFSWTESVIDISIVLVAESHHLWVIGYDEKIGLRFPFGSNMKNYCNGKILRIFWKNVFVAVWWSQNLSPSFGWYIFPSSCNPK